MLTLQRYERGMPQGTFDLGDVSAIAAELQSLVPQKTHVFTQPASFTEALERLHPFVQLNSERRPGFDDVERGEFQLLIRSLQRHLPRDAAKLSTAQRDEMKLLMFQAKTWHAWLTPDVTRAWSGGPTDAEGWWRFVNGHPFFRSAAWEENIKALVPELEKYNDLTFDFSSIGGGSTDMVPRTRANLEALSMALPPERIMALYGEQLKYPLVNQRKRVIDEKNVIVRLASTTLPPELNIRLGNMMLETIWPRRGPSSHASQIAELGLLDFYGDGMQHDVALLRREGRFAERSELTAVADACDANLARLWEQSRLTWRRSSPSTILASIDWRVLAAAAKVDEAAVAASGSQRSEGGRKAAS